MLCALKERVFTVSHGMKWQSSRASKILEFRNDVCEKFEQRFEFFAAIQE